MLFPPFDRDEDETLHTPGGEKNIVHTEFRTVKVII